MRGQFFLHPATGARWLVGIRSARGAAVTSKISILLVEDDAVVRQALTQALAIEGFNVVPAANADEAMLGIAANPIDVLLIDQDLGLESGINTFAQLRTIQPSLPVILMSARSERNTTVLAKGVNAVVEKPLLDLPMLFRALSELATDSRVAAGSVVHPSLQIRAGLNDPQTVVRGE